MVANTVETVAVAAAAGIAAAVVDLGHVGAGLVGRRAGEDIVPAGHDLASGGGGAVGVGIKVLAVGQRHSLAGGVEGLGVGHTTVVGSADGDDGDHIVGIGNQVGGGVGRGVHHSGVAANGDEPAAFVATGSPGEVDSAAADGSCDVADTGAGVDAQVDVVDGCGRLRAAATVVAPHKYHFICSCSGEGEFACLGLPVGLQVQAVAAVEGDAAGRHIRGVVEAAVFTGCQHGVGRNKGSADKVE